MARRPGGGGEWKGGGGYGDVWNSWEGSGGWGMREKRRKTPKSSGTQRRVGPAASRRRPAPVHQRGPHFLHHAAVFLAASARKGDAAAIGPGGFLLADHRHAHVQGVAMPDPGQDAPGVDLQQREQSAVVDAAGVLQAAHDGIDQRAMRNRLAERRPLAIL